MQTAESRLSWEELQLHDKSAATAQEEDALSAASTPPEKPSFLEEFLESIRRDISKNVRKSDSVGTPTCAQSIPSEEHASDERKARFNSGNVRFSRTGTDPDYSSIGQARHARLGRFAETFSTAKVFRAWASAAVSTSAWLEPTSSLRQQPTDERTPLAQWWDARSAGSVVVMTLRPFEASEPALPETAETLRTVIAPADQDEPSTSFEPFERFRLALSQSWAVLDKLDEGACDKQGCEHTHVRARWTVWMAGDREELHAAAQKLRVSEGPRKL